MVVEQIAPWVSLFAAILSIAYVAASYRRTRSDGAADSAPATGSGSSIAGFVDEYTEFVLVLATLVTLSVVAHVGLRGTRYFYPSLIWGVSGLCIVVVAIGEVTDLEELD